MKLFGHSSSGRSEEGPALGFARFGFSIPILVWAIHTLANGRIIKVNPNSATSDFLLWCNFFVTCAFLIFMWLIGEATLVEKACHLRALIRGVNVVAGILTLAVIGVWMSFFASVLPEHWEEAVQIVRLASTKWKLLDGGTKFSLVGGGFFLLAPVILFLTGLPAAIRVVFRAARVILAFWKRLLRRYEGRDAW